MRMLNREGVHLGSIVLVETDDVAGDNTARDSSRELQISDSANSKRGSRRAPMHLTQTRRSQSA